jgi:hypothetical protein
MAGLSVGATVLGDRNLGVFWMAYAAQQRGLRVLLRLAKVRARKLVGAVSQAEYAAVWNASRWDAESTLRGRRRLGQGPSDSRSHRSGQVQTMVLSFYRARITHRGDRQTLRLAMES